jgi:hypothetical protein
MATISELVAKHSKVPGDIKVRRQCRGPSDWFRPYFPIGDEWWRGQSFITPDARVSSEFNDWQLYTEPKPKIKRWLWADPVIGTHCTPRMSGHFYTEDEALNMDLKNWIKLEWSMQEFEE